MKKMCTYSVDHQRTRCPRDNKLYSRLSICSKFPICGMWVKNSLGQLEECRKKKAGEITKVSGEKLLNLRQAGSCGRVPSMPPRIVQCKKLKCDEWGILY